MRTTINQMRARMNGLHHDILVAVHSGQELEWVTYAHLTAQRTLARWGAIKNELLPESKTRYAGYKITKTGEELLRRWDEQPAKRRRSGPNTAAK